MDAKAFQRAEEMFNAALDLPRERRDEFLSEACDGDAAMHSRVSRMLRYADREVVLGSPRSPRPAATAEPPGTTIGPYRIVELIGEGGFGAVYLAAQETPVKRRVALKIIKLGMDTERVIARFEAERQALAMMHHTGIARVFDAGATETGRPYFAMELVEGVPITEHAEANELTVPQRLDLFALVCQAVQHAHQRGIIHRDLKPSNVLVAVEDGRAIPKVIDFGIAKATNQQLTEKTIFTDFKQLVGTPAYMSPEQAAMTGRDVDTRSDIYSLGVLLYELVTGAFPYRVVGNPHEVLRCIREVEPVRPGKYRADLDDDVETIVLTCLRKEPDRRYQSAGELARDVRHYRAGEPLEARRDSGWYVLRKRLRRHRVALGVAGAFLALLSVSTVVAWSLYATAERARADATERLWTSSLAQAKAARFSNRPGRRADSLAAIRAAAEIRPSLELRDEAIAAMALFDMCSTWSYVGQGRPSAEGLTRIDRFALGDDEGGTTIVFVAGERNPARLAGPPLFVRVMRFSPDGRYVAVKYHTDDRTALWVWDIDRGEPVFKLPITASSDAFELTARSLAAAHPDGAVHVYDLAAGVERARIPTGAPAYKLAVDPTGRLIAVSNGVDRDVVIHDVRSGAEVRRMAAGTLVYDLEWSGDGRWIAGAGADQVAYVWDASTGALERTLAGHQGEVTRIKFGPTDRLLATSSWDRTTRLWDAKTGEPLLGPLEHQALTAFGDRVALYTDTGGSFTLWRLDQGREHQTLTVESPFRNPVIAVSGDGRLLAAAGVNGLRLWDLPTRALLGVLATNTVFDVFFSERGERVFAVTTDGLAAWPLRRGEHGVTIGAPELIWPEPGIRKVCPIPGGGRIVVSGRASLEIFDLDDRRVITAFPRYPGMSKPAVSRDGRWIFTETWKGEPARIWDARDGAVVREYAGDSVRGFFSPDGRWLVVSSQHRHRFLEVGTWRLARELKTVAGPVAVGFSADAETVAVKADRSEVCLYDVATGTPLAHFADPQLQPIGDLGFTARGDLVMATTGRTIHIWHLDLVREHLRDLGLDWSER